MIERGRGWGQASEGPPDLTVRGGDAELADAARDHPGARLAFEPDATSDLARALGVGGERATPGARARVDVSVDLLELGDGGVAVNAVVLGAPPAQIGFSTLGTHMSVAVDDQRVFEGRATTVVVASGEYLDGDDVFPRGHPGDGRAEVQVYAVGRRERRAMRTRLADGTHVPHPGITQASGRTVLVRAPARVPVVADGRPRGSPDVVRIDVRPAAVTLVL